jgi:hypothetical protein
MQTPLLEAAGYRPTRHSRIVPRQLRATRNHICAVEDVIVAIRLKSGVANRNGLQVAPRLGKASQNLMAKMASSLRQVVFSV